MQVRSLNVDLAQAIRQVLAELPRGAKSPSRLSQLLTANCPEVRTNCRRKQVLIANCLDAHHRSAQQPSANCQLPSANCSPLPLMQNV